MEADAESPHTGLFIQPSEEDNTYVGAWNVRSHFAVGKAAQVAREMEMNRCEIIVLSEMRWGGLERIKLTTGQTLLFSCRKDNLHRQGVGMLMSGNATKALVSWKLVNERIITARFYSKYAKTTMTQIYARTEDSSEEDKDDCCEQLQTVINTIPKHDIKVIIGDLNAKVGETTWDVKR